MKKILALILGLALLIVVFSYIGSAYVPYYNSYQSSSSASSYSPFSPGYQSTNSYNSVNTGNDLGNGVYQVSSTQTQTSNQVYSPAPYLSNYGFGYSNSYYPGNSNTYQPTNTYESNTYPGQSLYRSVFWQMPVQYSWPYQPYYDGYVNNNYQGYW